MHAELNASLRADSHPGSNAGAKSGTDSCLNTESDLEARLGSDTDSGTNAAGRLHEGQPGSGPDETGLHAQPALSDQTGVDAVRQTHTNVGRDRACQPDARVRGDQAHVRSNEAGVTGHQSGVAENGACVLRDEAGHDTRIRRWDREAVLISHGLLQGADRVVGGDDRAGDCARDGRGDLGGRDVDQTGVGHGLPGCSDERLCRLFAAEQAQDVVN